MYKNCKVRAHITQKVNLAGDVSCSSCQLHSKHRHRSRRLPAPPFHPQVTPFWCQGKPKLPTEDNNYYWHCNIFSCPQTAQSVQLSVFLLDTISFMTEAPPDSDYLSLSRYLIFQLNITDFCQISESLAKSINLKYEMAKKKHFSENGLFMECIS